MNEIRSNELWVVVLSAAVSSHIHKFVRCRRQRRSTEGQKIADLPQERAESTLSLRIVGWIVLVRLSSEKDAMI